MVKSTTIGLAVSLALCLLMSCSSEPDDSIGFSTPDTMPLSVETDTVPLQVILAYPGGIGHFESCEVAWGTHVLVAFSKPIDPQSVSTETFYVENGTSGRIEVCGNVITYIQRLAFDNLVAVRVVVGGEIRDMAGNTLGDDYEFVFCTRGDP